MKFVAYRDNIGGWRWRLVGRNGEIVAQGESYTRRASVLRAIARIQEAVPVAAIEVVE